LPARRNLAVFSMLKDKDILSSLKPIARLIDTWYIASLTNKRAADLPRLVADLKKTGVKNHEIKEFDNISQAIVSAISDAKKKNYRIIVFGSFYVVCEVLKLFKGLNFS
jgi:dihydrofolate synthase / folylpolyglutamate synthase